MKSTLNPVVWALVAALSGAQAAPYDAWAHAASFYVLTTPDGADLPADVVERGFPLLVRLQRDTFDFGQARPDGGDLRFSTADGTPLPYQIDQWQPALGTACIWVRLPILRGNERQELRLHWGKADAVSESVGAAVFAADNGYASVWHLGERVADEVGTLTSRDVGTTLVPGIVGTARHLAGRQGIFGGDRIADYPSGAAPHSTEAWFRAERPNTTIIGWGNEGGGQGSKVRMINQSPPHIRIDSDFADVRGTQRVPLSAWTHVVHTYDGGTGRIYVNGRLDASATPKLNIKSPSRLWLGGWYDNYDFVGDLDEVRISRVARSAAWIRLEYENQKPLGSLVGPPVQPGQMFSVSPTRATVNEGGSVSFDAQAGGALKLAWVLRRDGAEQIVAVDRLHVAVDAGRVSGDQTATLQLRAAYPDGLKTVDVPIAIRETIPDPLFTLRAPARWDGRQTIELVPELLNKPGSVQTTWRIDGLAVAKEALPGRLRLTRALGSGAMTVTATLTNGGRPVSRSVTLAVTEPPRDAWVVRGPDKDEQPEDNQFYARDDRGEGTLHYRGTLTEPADTVFLRVLADGQPYRAESHKIGADRAYAFAVRLRPGLVHYSVELGSNTVGGEKVLRRVSNLVCGDAYLIDGQSNAVATDWGREEPTFHSEWIRSYGSMSGSPQGLRLWGEACYRSRDGEKLQIGYWGMELAKRLLENHKVPICILNGAVGGTRIDMHQRNAANPEDMTTIYGRLLWRVRQARLTHGIRGIFWHQGENDQGADGPTGGFGWETYRQYFIDMAAAWQQDYPNVGHCYLFQIWPKSCAMGVDGSDNRLREVQRTLPGAFSKLGIMSTLGIEPPGGCHYPAEGYAEIARLIYPLVARDHYSVVPKSSITPPNLVSVSWTSDRHDAVRLVFDQPVVWRDALTSQFYLDGQRGQVTAGAAAGGVLTLTLAARSSAATITYLDSASWSQANLLKGQNNIAALTFCEVPIGEAIKGLDKR
ncbi:MAG: DUF2341 domain-containing protein [Armatimonadetes bacterium]|nr:DUF2341 domain-containing protein [Armatimonadota bacterium]